MAKTRLFYVVHAFYRGVYCGAANASGICDAIRDCLSLKAGGYCYELTLYECEGSCVMSIADVCNG